MYIFQSINNTQSVRYKGAIEGSEASFNLDDHHNFPKGKMMLVCGNTYKMLYDTRYRDDFEFFGDWSTHYGIFEGCGGKMPFTVRADGSVAPSCC